MADGLTPSRMDFVVQTLGLERCQNIEEALAIAAVTVDDTRKELEHWKGAAAKVQMEITMLAAVMMKQQKVQRLIIREHELRELPRNQELTVGNPEPGVRVYEMRERRATAPAAERGRVITPK